MAETYEVVFQRVAVGDLFTLLKTLEISSKSLSGLAVSENVGNLGLEGVDKGLIDAISACEESVCLIEQLHGFRASEEICLPFALLRVIKYKDGVDVELSFEELQSFDICRVMLAMQMYSEALSNRFSMSEYYGGLEPAVWSAN